MYSSLAAGYSSLPSKKPQLPKKSSSIPKTGSSSPHWLLASWTTKFTLLCSSLKTPGSENFFQQAASALTFYLENRENISLAGSHPKIQNSHSLSSLKTVPAAFTIFIHLPVSPHLYVALFEHLYALFERNTSSSKLQNREIISLAGE